MPAPARSRSIRKEAFNRTFKPTKAIQFQESTPRTSSSSTTTTPSIRALSWSPTGVALATASGPRIRIWNPERPVVRSSIELGGAGGHVGYVERVEWNPVREGEVASTGQDGSVRLWDVRVGGGAVGTVGVGVQGKSSCVGDAKLGDGGLFLSWHPGGTQMVVGRRDDVIVVVDVRKGVLGEVELGTTEKGKLGTGQTNQCAFSHSGREFFATTSEGTIKILDWPTLSPLHTLPAHTTAAYSIASSPSGSFLATGGADSLITLWETHSWTCAHTLDKPATAIHSLSFSFDGTYIVGAHGLERESSERSLEIACAMTGEYVCSMETTGCPTVVAWHPLRYWLAYAGDAGGVKVFGMAQNL